MKLMFPPPDSSNPPEFKTVATFHCLGAVMNVFLLDPLSRIMSVFLWIPSTNSLGLYVIPDWDQPQEVHFDTGIICVRLFCSGIIE
jgi:hypothetical protein